MLYEAILVIRKADAVIMDNFSSADLASYGKM